MRNIIAFLCLLSATISYSQSTVFDTSGTWTCPAGVTSVTVECRGGGGGGGYAATRTDGNHSIGTGGGGGCYSRKILSVTPGQVYAVTVGEGGLGGDSVSINGENGGDSWFSFPGLVLAKGGGAGTGDNPGTTGVAGSGSIAGSIGDVIYFGGGGGIGRVTGSTTMKVYGGGGGSSAGSTGNGNQGYQSNVGGGPAQGTSGAGGNGGGTPPNIIMPGSSFGEGGPGENGSNPGGGGGGSAVRNTQPAGTLHNGGNGGKGRVTITPSTSLPVDLIYFTASYTEQQTILFKWKVARRDVKSIRYSIEASKEGERFIEIYSREYTGVIPAEYNYEYIPSNNPGLYYRFKSVDESGTVKYSNTIQINGNNRYANTPISIYPNPCQDASIIGYYASAEGTVSVDISDIAGRKVFSRHYNIEEGYNQLSLNTTSLHKGIYSVKMDDSNGKPLFAGRLVKK